MPVEVVPGSEAAEDGCEVYSRSKGEWVAGVVTQVSGSRLEGEYGDRTRSVNLDDPKLDEYFRSARLRLDDAPRQLQLQDRGGRQVRFNPISIRF